jgi:hypothetical protein
MSKPSKLVRVECPGCRLVLWLDPATGDIIKTEKTKKEKASLDHLLVQERQKQLAADKRYSSTAQLRDIKKTEARKRFDEVLSKVEDGEEKD